MVRHDGKAVEEEGVQFLYAVEAFHGFARAGRITEDRCAMERIGGHEQQRIVLDGMPLGHGTIIGGRRIPSTGPEYHSDGTVPIFWLG